MSSARLNLMRVHSSASKTRSRIIGVARRLSSQVLCTAIVFKPPIMISDVYSSIARFESPERTNIFSISHFILNLAPIFKKQQTNKRAMTHQQTAHTWWQPHDPASPPPCTGSNWRQPYHPPRCSWRSPLSGTVAVPIDFCHRCCPNGCSLRCWTFWCRH